MITRLHKQIFRVLLVAVLMAATLPASAYDFMVDGLAYNINEGDSTVSVTYITENDFHNYEGVTQIDVPAEVVYQWNTYTVTKIGEHAFNCCPDLQKVSLAGTVTSVGKWAFEGCNKLDDIDLGSVKEFSRGAFQYDKALQSITIPEGVERLDTLLFQSCISLTNVNLPTTLKEIQRSAFYGCKSLTSITLPQSLRSIEEAAFSTCNKLATIKIPRSVESMGQKVFYGCDSLRNIYSCSAPSAIDVDENLFNGLDTTLVRLYVPMRYASDYIATSPWNHVLIFTLDEEDVDGDGIISSVDITAIYNYLLNGDDSFGSTLDVDGDGICSSVDITMIYNTLLNGGAADIEEFDVGGVTFKMVKVKKGAFVMGLGRNGENVINYHNVTLSRDYYIGQTEVTQELWEAVMGDGHEFDFPGAKKPAQGVSWNDCMSFIQKLNTITGRNFRLPTEAEWEYAARGGEKSSGYLYSGSDNLDSVGWYADNSQGRELHEVASKAPNELGLYDMSGNVYEWCSDIYRSYVAEPQLDPTCPEDGSLGRINRGGGFNSPYYNCYVRTRSHAPTTQAGYYLGFRLALSKGD